MATKRKRTSFEDIRRVELIEAAHRVFMADGLSGMTTARICEEAGMSPGILAYYFKGKDEVLFGMVRYNNRILMEEVIERLKTAKSRWERLTAIIEGNFPPDAFNRNAANAWLSVVSAAHTNSQYARLQRIFYKRLGSNVSSSLSGILPAKQLKAITLSISVMIDGLWLRKATGSDLTHTDAVQVIVDHIRAALTANEVKALGGRAE